MNAQLQIVFFVLTHPIVSVKLALMVLLRIADCAFNVASNSVKVVWWQINVILASMNINWLIIHVSNVEF
jgi:hypothetical protein